MSEAAAIGFAGLSHLGIIYSTAAAVRGFDIVAFDVNAELVKKLAAGQFPIVEPGLEDAFLGHRDRIRYTSDAGAFAACRLIFITLDVSTDESNSSQLAPLQSLVERVAASAAPGTALVIMSQLPPGFCRQLATKLPPGLDLYYQVETLVFGNALERAIHPERYMVGCADPTQPYPDAYHRFLRAFECPVLAMRFESAELCKIAINCFLVSTVCTANTLAEICERIQADWSEVIPALRLDRRIGPHAYLNPGLGISGGNLERDLVTVQKIGAEHGCDTQVVTAWQQNSAYARDWVLRRLFQVNLLQDPDSLLALWGLAYKPDTHSTKNSPSLALLRSLPNYRWRAYDPVARIEKPEFPNLRLCSSPLDAVEGATALVVMTPWKQFAATVLESVRDAMRGRHILDPYGALDSGLCQKLGFRYHRLGVQPC